MLFADCPRPCGCGRVTNGEGSNGALLNEDTEACGLSFCGDTGLCGGDSVPGLPVGNRGEVMRVLFDTVELGLGGGKCGEGDNCRSGWPLAWKNFG
jgi:hypothetical protein